MSSKEQIIEVESLPVDIQTGATYAIKQANPNSIHMECLNIRVNLYRKFRDGE